MKKFILFFSSLIVASTIYLVFIDSKAFFNSLIDTLNIWLMKVFPSLFTFFVITSILINFKIINYFSFLLSPLKKILKFETDEAFNIFILSIFNGNPSTIIFINQSIENNKITLKDANTLLKCASFVSPFFILSFFKKEFAYILIISHLLSNFILCFFLNRNNKTIINKEENDNKINIVSFLDSIQKEISIMLLIASMMCVCNILKYSLLNILSFFDFNNNYSTIFLSLIEISTGLNDLISINLPIIYLIIFSSFLISFGGFCIHLQVASILNKNLKYKSYFFGRITQGIISMIISFLFILMV